MKIYDGISQLVGRTPLVRLNNLEKALGLKSAIIGKLEFLNPAGSAKDRIAKEILDALEKENQIKQGSVIIEPTSGNTGVGLAALAAERGYKAVIVMPSSMSRERQALIKAYGAEVVLTDGALGMSGAIDEAERLHSKIAGSVIAGQFTNPNNPAAHYKTTGPEIYEDTDGEIDFFVSGIGTGGTISGVGAYLKEKNENIKIVGVEPAGSAVLSGGEAHPHGIQGIGAGFVPKTLNITVVDRIIPIEDEEAKEYARLIGRTEGIAVGISSGAALAAAVKLARENVGKKTVVLFPDGVDRYLSGDLIKE